MLPLFFFATIVVASQGSDLGPTHQIHLLRPQLDSRGDPLPDVSCLSWRLGVETRNIIGWRTVPQECAGYVGHYMLGHQYRKDSQVVTKEASVYVQSLRLTGDGKNVWIFDIDETTLSNLPYFAQHGFGAKPYDATSFNQWVIEGKAPALPESLKLYKKVLSLGVKVVFITGRSEAQRNATATNLKHVGCHTWEKLILKGSGHADAGATATHGRAPSYTGKTAMAYKSSEREKLEKNGYRIIGNIGDQWSDLMGTNAGNRTFKLPDPMYYIN